MSYFHIVTNLQGQLFSLRNPLWRRGKTGKPESHSRRIFCPQQVRFDQAPKPQPRFRVTHWRKNNRASEGILFTSTLSTGQFSHIRYGHQLYVSSSKSGWSYHNCTQHCQWLFHFSLQNGHGNVWLPTRAFHWDLLEEHRRRIKWNIINSSLKEDGGLKLEI